jgi:hypothetical protein
VVAKGESRNMDPQTLNLTIDDMLQGMRDRLEEASAIAKAATTCAEAGNHDQAVTIALDIEQLVYEVNTLLNAASLIKRCNSP